MDSSLAILLIEAMGVYFLVLWTHSLRSRFGLAHFYACLGGLTAVMSWVTDAGVRVAVGDITFMVGSTVFYTALLLGVFVVYVFDGPRATRIAISTVAGVSILVPVIAAVLHLQTELTGATTLTYVPTPSLRINTASVLATIMDLVFLAIAWEFLGRSKWRLPLGIRTFVTLLGVMWLDVILFSAGAFLGTPSYVSIMTGTFLTRLIVSVFAYPFLYGYLVWQNRKTGVEIEHRPVLSILHEVAEVRQELTVAQQEIERRTKAEREKEALIERLQHTLSRIRTLEGLLPVCSGCKKIRVDASDPAEPDNWVPLEDYIRDETTVGISHGMCMDCLRKAYPDLPEDVILRSSRRAEDPRAVKDNGTRNA